MKKIIFLLASFVAFGIQPLRSEGLADLIGKHPTAAGIAIGLGWYVATACVTHYFKTEPECYKDEQPSKAADRIALVLGPLACRDNGFQYLGYYLIPVTAGLYKKFVKPKHQPKGGEKDGTC
jgi:hypothetical protein